MTTGLIRAVSSGFANASQSKQRRTIMAQTKDQNTTDKNKTPAYIAWNVTGKDDKTFWQKIGACWPHQDGKGLSLQLEVLPINGRIVLRKPQADGDKSSQK
jgi:hypothetical protein